MQITAAQSALQLHSLFSLISVLSVLVNLVEDDDEGDDEGVVDIRIHSHTECVLPQQHTLNCVVPPHLHGAEPNPTEFVSLRN